MAASTIINWAQNRFLHHWHHFLQERKARSWEVEQPDKNSFNQNRASEFNPRPIYPQIGIKVKRSATFKLISYCCQISGLKLTERRCFMTNVEAGQLPIFSLYHQYLQPEPCFKHQYIGPMLAKLKLEFFNKKFLGIAFSFFLLRNKFAKLRRCVAGYFAKIHSGNLKVLPWHE